MLELKADPLRNCGGSGETALHVASRCGRFGAGRALLDHGVPADLKDQHGRTPLSIALIGKEMHVEHCHNQGCERCEARIQMHGELRWRVERGPTNDPAAMDTNNAAAGIPQSTP